MRTRIMGATAWLALATAPLAAHAAIPANPAAGAAPNAAVAPAQPGTVLPGVTVTAPAPPSTNPWAPSTWRVHAGDSRYQPKPGVITGGYGGSGDGVVIAHSR